MYQALYRKWRPRSFDDVVGQAPITKTLKNEVASGRIGQAYLFTGSRGTGKTTCAKILAKAVNCPNAKDGEPCLTCPTCLGIDDGSVLDVVEQDAASNNGVDDVRILRENANFSPVQCRYRVYILDEAHMLSVQAVNALLKITEEPPPHVIFILATTEVLKIPETLRSRCQRFDFKRITEEDIAARLLYIADEEKIALLPAAAARIAGLARGGMRDAIGLLDQATSIAETVDVETVDLVAGVIGRDHLFELVEEVRAGDTAGLMETIDGLYRRSFDLDRLCGDLHAYFRDLMLVKTCKAPEKLLGAPGEAARLSEQAKGFSLAAVLHAMSALQEAQSRIGRSANARAELETCLLRVGDAGLDDTVEALVRRIDALEARLAGVASGTAAALPGKAPGAATAPKPAERAAAQREEPTAPAFAVPDPVAGEGVSAQTEPQYDAPPEPMPPEPDTARRPRAASPASAPEPIAAEVWDTVRADVARQNAPLAGAMNGTNAYIEGKRVLIAGGETFMKLLRENETAKNSLKEAIRQRLGRPMGIGPYKAAVSETKLDRFERMTRLAVERGLLKETPPDGE